MGIWRTGLLREAETQKMGRERQATVREGLQDQLWVLRASSLASVAWFLAVLQQSLMGASKVSGLFLGETKDSREAQASGELIM